MVNFWSLWCERLRKMKFQRYNEGDEIQWANASETEGKILFTFDGGKTVFNSWTDYPAKLTSEQIEIFKRINPTLAELKPTK